MKYLLIIFSTLLICSCCSKDETKAELLIGKWCLEAESTTNIEWVKSDKFTLEFERDGMVKLIYKDNQMNCESTFVFEETTLEIKSGNNCINFYLEMVNDSELILYQKGREEIFKFKFIRC
jgi:major membrane immunogen (membrane-anchored lipoprotein)